MSEDFQDLQRLLRLKRHERPPEGYLESFAGEFQRRQREEMLRRSSRSLFIERLGTFIAGFGAPRWAYAAGAAYAAAMIALFLHMQGGAVLGGGGEAEVAAPAPMMAPGPGQPVLQPVNLSGPAQHPFLIEILADPDAPRAEQAVPVPVRTDQRRVIREF